MEITMFNGKTHYKWPFSIAMLNYQRVYSTPFTISTGASRIGPATSQCSDVRNKRSPHGDEGNFHPNAKHRGSLDLRTGPPEIHRNPHGF
jgi:hypothetical protein